MNRKGYTKVPNALFTDHALTVGARFVCAYLMSNKADWEYTAANISHAVGMCEDWTNARLRELEKAGMLTREFKRENGKFSGIIYKLADTDIIGNGDIGNDSIGTDNVGTTRIIYKEKKNKEKKTMCVAQAQNAHTQPEAFNPLEFFREHTKEAARKLQTTPQVCRKFEDYWCQVSDGVMLWQQQRAFDFFRRLKKWIADERQQPTRAQLPSH